jgi:thioredoxin-dependent peroxiredoxin
MWVYENMKNKASEFCLLDQNGKKVCLNDFRGKWVVLYFYPKDNSKSCILEDVSFTDNLKTLEEMGAVVVGVSPDSVKSHQNFGAKHDLNFVLLSNPEHEVLESYGVWALKKMY